MSDILPDHVRNAAIALLRLLAINDDAGGGWNYNLARVCEALLEAENRGREQERQRCLRIAEHVDVIDIPAWDEPYDEADPAAGVIHHPGFKQKRYPGHVSIATAIRTGATE